MARLPKRARNNFFFSKKEKVEEVNRPELLAWVQAAEKSVPYSEGQQYLVRLPDRRGRWVWYYVTYPTERSFDEASESTVPVRLIREDSPWSTVRFNMKSTRYPDELSVVVLNSQSKTVEGPVRLADIKARPNPVDFRFAMQQQYYVLESLRRKITDLKDRLIAEGYTPEQIMERLSQSREGQQLLYNLDVLERLDYSAAARQAFGPSRLEEEARANSGLKKARAAQVAVVRRAEKRLMEQALQLEKQGVPRRQIREILLAQFDGNQIAEERKVLDALNTAWGFERTFHSRSEAPTAEANPAPLVGVAAQIATSVALNMGIEAWGKLTAMSVAERAAWLEEAARKASWLSGIGGFVYQHAPVGKARKKVWLEISKAMTSPEVTSAVRTAAVTSAVGKKH